MKKNIRDYKVNGKQFAYFLDCIYFEGVDEDATDKEKIIALWNDFNRVANYPANKKWFPNLQDRMADYLQGLPIAITFEDHKIAEIGRSWGYCQTPAKEAKFVENWWSVAAFRYIQLANYFGIALPN